MGATTLIGKECGTFDEACKRAVEFAKRHAKPHEDYPYATLEQAQRFLERAGWSHATFGIESASCDDRELAYLNTGDTYSLTVGQEGDDIFSTTWGDWQEGAEEKYCEENDRICCGYCGEFTPVDSDNWRKTVCEHCGRYVDSGEKPRKRCKGR